MPRETGVKNLTAFPIESEGAYGSAIPLKNCVSLNTTNNYTEISYNSDCTVEYSSSRLDDVDVEIEMSSKMAYSLLAQLTGMEYANGKASTVVNPTICISLLYSFR